MTQAKVGGAFVAGTAAVNFIFFSLLSIGELGSSGLAIFMNFMIAMFGGLGALGGAVAAGGRRWLGAWALVGLGNACMLYTQAPPNLGMAANALVAPIFLAIAVWQRNRG